MSPAVVAARAAEVRAEIEAACRRVGRDARDVVLVAVTKGHGGDAVGAAVAAGLDDLGENYVQELEQKHRHAPRARWHFLGRVQSNKARRVAALAAVVHGLEPGRAAVRLADAVEPGAPPLACLLEVDFTGRRQGVGPEEVRDAVAKLGALPGLDLRGLMTMPPPTPDAEAARPYFVRLRELRDALAPDLPELSMGMSADFPVALEEGATMVRVGTAIFGSRPT